MTIETAQALAIIADIEMETAFGNAAKTVAAMTARDNAFRRHPTFIGQDGRPFQAAYVEALGATPQLSARLAGLLVPVLTRLLARHPGPHALVLALPTALQSLSLQSERFFDRMRGAGLDGIGEVFLHFGENCTGFYALEALPDVFAKSGSVIWAGVDSRVSADRIDLDPMLRPSLGQGSPYAPVPGEAAAACLLRPMTAKTGLGVLSRPVCGSEPHHADTGIRPPLGTGLAQAIRSVQPMISTCSGLISDMNSERFRAEEFGVAAPLIARDLRDRVLCPALSLGDLGAAYPVLSAGLVCGNLKGSCLILASEPAARRAIAFVSS